MDCKHLKKYEQTSAKHWINSKVETSWYRRKQIAEVSLSTVFFLSLQLSQSPPGWRIWGCRRTTSRYSRWLGAAPSGRSALCAWKTVKRCLPSRSSTSGRCWRGPRRPASRRRGTSLCTGTGGGSPTSTSPFRTTPTWWVGRPRCVPVKFFGLPEKPFFPFQRRSKKIKFR